MPTMSNPLPPELQVPQNTTTLPAPNFGQPGPSYTPTPFTPIAGAAPVNPFQVADPTQATNSVQASLDNILNSGNPYMANARRSGLEAAAARGLMNSSIAAGSSQRSAIEAAMPVLREAMGLQGQRETQGLSQNESALDRALQQNAQANQLNFTGQQNQFDRTFQQTQGDANRWNQIQLQRETNAFQGEQNQLNRNQQQTMAQIQDWMNNNQFNREFYGALSTMPIKGAMDLNNMLAQYALDNPEIYTQNTITGITNFFNQNMMNVLKQYWPTVYNAPPGGQ